MPKEEVMARLGARGPKLEPAVKVGWHSWAINLVRFGDAIRFTTRLVVWAGTAILI